MTKNTRPTPSTHARCRTCRKPLAPRDGTVCDRCTAVALALAETLFTRAPA